MPPQYPSLNNQAYSQREKIASGVPRRFLVFSTFFFGGILLLYLGLHFGYAAFLRAQIKDSKDELTALGQKIPADDQKELVQIYSQVNNIQRLLTVHVFPSRTFSFFESNTVKKVAYLGTDLSVPDRRLTIDGVAVSYDELVKQLAAYEEAPEVERVNLETSDIAGKVVRFKIHLTLKPEVFKP